MILRLKKERHPFPRDHLSGLVFFRLHFEKRHDGKGHQNRKTGLLIWFCSLKAFRLPASGSNESCTVRISAFVGRLGGRSRRGTLKLFHSASVAERTLALGKPCRGSLLGFSLSTPPGVSPLRRVSLVLLFLLQ